MNKPMNPTQTTPDLLARGAGAALQWRLLLSWSAALLLPAAVLTLPVLNLLSEQLDHAVGGAALARRLDFLALSDLALALQHAMPALNTAGIAAALLALLLMPLQSAMLAVAARVRLAGPAHGRASAGFGALLTGGFAGYGRMLRMLVWAIVPLGAALALGAAALHGAHIHNGSAILSADAARLNHGALVLAVLLFLFADLTLDAGRAALAAEAQRTSAVKAWWRGLRLLARRPVAAIGAWLLITAAGLLLAALLAVARIRLAGIGAGTGGLVALFLLTQLAALTLAWMRGARLFVLIVLTRERLAAAPARPAVAQAIRAGEELATQ